MFVRVFSEFYSSKEFKDMKRTIAPPSAGAKRGFKKPRRATAPTSTRKKAVLYSNVKTGSRMELKVIDSGATNAQMNTTGTFILLNGLTQGTDYDQRLGRKFIIKSIQARGWVTPEYDNSALGAISVPSQYGRIIIFVDNQSNGATPVTTDLLTVPLPNAPLNLNNRDRFRILRDFQFVFGPLLSVTTATQSQAAFGGNQITDVNFYERVDIETVNNAGNAGTVADIQSGAVYAFYIGSQAAGTNTDLNANLYYRLRFSDQ